jgi:hypothetical protein
VFSKYSLLPITARIRRAFGHSLVVADEAAETVVLSPADESPTLPAISLPGEFDRVIGVEPNSTFERERQYLTAPRLPHGSTIAYRLKHALLADHTLYSRGRLVIYRGVKKNKLLLGQYREFDEAQLCTYAPSNIYFGHWLRDALAMELLAEQRNLAALSFEREPWIHEPGYRELMKLSGAPVSFAQVRNLWVIDDRGLNAGWIARFRELRRRIRATVNTRGPSHVFLARGKRGTLRELTNAALLTELLIARGFEIIEPELLSPREIARALASARIVVTVEGSALNHAHYAIPHHSGILVIQPPDRFNAFHKILMDFNGVRFGYVVGEKATGGFVVEPDRLLRSLDLLETALDK